MNRRLSVREHKPSWRTICVVTALICAIGGVSSSAQGLATLDAIARAHGADEVPTVSVQITGKVERNGKVEPFRLFATRDEELRIEYGSGGKDTLVATSKVIFRSDGEKFTFAPGGSRFNQLDLTGLFFVQQLRNRAVRVEIT